MIMRRGKTKQDAFHAITNSILFASENEFLIWKKNRLQTTEIWHGKSRITYLFIRNKEFRLR